MSVVDIGRNTKLKNIINNMTITEKSVVVNSLYTVDKDLSFMEEVVDTDHYYEVRYGPHFAEYQYFDDEDIFVGLVYLDNGEVLDIDGFSTFSIIEQIANHILDSEEKK